MRRTLLLLSLAVCMLLPAPRGARAADDDDPVVGGTKKKVSDFIALLKNDKDADRRKAAVVILVEIIGPRPRAVLPAICAALKSDEDATVRTAAAQGLGAMHDKAEEYKIDQRLSVEALKNALSGSQADKDETVRAAAATALGKMGQDARPAVDVLVTALKDKPAVLRAAADSLDRLGKVADGKTSDIKVSDTEDARAAMAKLLKDKSASAFARISAASYVTKVIDAETAVPMLIGLLKDEPQPPAELHRSVLETLGRYGQAAADAAPQLRDAFDKKNNLDVRIAAGAALAQIGPAAAIALPQVRAALKDDDKFIRIQALEVIARLGKDAALGTDTNAVVDDVISCLKREQNSAARVAAINALGEIGSAAKSAVELLTDLAKSPQQGTHDAAEAALKKIQG